MFHAKKIREELLEQVEERIEAASMRKEPTLANYMSILNKFIQKQN